MDVPENTIRELKDKKHKEPSVTKKVTSYFNIYEIGINLLDNMTLRINECSWPHQRMNNIRR